MATLGRNKPLGSKKMYTKVCQYPGCDCEYEGIGASKYCEEHQKPIYKKKLAEEKKEKEAKLSKYYDRSNIEYHHNFGSATEIIRKCLCGREYSIKLFPGVYKIPAYCEEHRVPHRRDAMINTLLKNGEIVEDSKSEIGYRRIK